MLCLRRMLTDADVCWRMLAYADECGSVVCSAYDKNSSCRMLCIRQESSVVCSYDKKVVSYALPTTRILVVGRALVLEVSDSSAPLN
jgi:hypothetical protein